MKITIERVKGGFIVDLEKGDGNAAIESSLNAIKQEIQGGADFLEAAIAGLSALMVPTEERYCFDNWIEVNHLVEEELKNCS